MTVFKNYFKIMKQYRTTIIIYTVIFVALAVFATNSGVKTNDFTAIKPNVAIINNDNETVLVEGFNDYLKENAIIKSVKNNEESLRDSLFFRVVDYILIIPENFTEDFITLKNPKIETMNIPDSYGAIYTEILLDRFLNIAKVYAASGMDQEEIIENIKIDLKQQGEVFYSEKTSMTNVGYINYYYNFSNYTFLAISVYIIGMIMNAFNDTKIKRRNLVSNFSYKKINRQLFAGNFCLMLLIWSIYVGISIILYPKAMFTNYGLLLIINSLVFSVTVLSIGFLIGNLVKNREATDGIVNVIALGSSFICGAFVPQEFLGNFVLSIAKFLPSYWYIKTNNDIVELTNFSLDKLGPIFTNMIIVLAFGVLFFIITNIVTKLKLKKS
ncbi:MAG: ABC transporter permease [Bacilli bacterium]|nr:ABC transporter permease [Bacilli bacterium]